MLQEKFYALTKRADQLIDRLAKPEHSTYTGVESTENITKQIDLIIWALEKSIDEDDFVQFRNGFNEARNKALEYTITGQEAEHMAQAIRMATDTLLAYRKYLLYPKQENS